MIHSSLQWVREVGITQRCLTTVEFFHPQSNSLPLKILDELAQTIHRAGNDDETRLVILSSAGEKVFCSGASFDELAAIQKY